MSKNLLKRITLFGLLMLHISASVTQGVGYIKGNMSIDESWEPTVYLSYLQSFDDEYAISNDIIISTAAIDGQGNYSFDLKDIPDQWSYLRLHIVKKNMSPNSLIIGSRDENNYFLIAKRDSQIKLHHGNYVPVFSNTQMEGVTFTEDFETIRKLSKYPTTLDYSQGVVEREFIQEIVTEKLKQIITKSENPMVVAYAFHNYDFQKDLTSDQMFYNQVYDEWQSTDNLYLQSFMNLLSMSDASDDFSSPGKDLNRIWFLIPVFIALSALGWFTFRKSKSTLDSLSVQERKIFQMLREGKSNKDIAAACNIELSTVKSHVSNIYSKLNIKSRKEAIDLNFKY